jgi:nucleotide-binding universal stress UspA family protein
MSDVILAVLATPERAHVVLDAAEQVRVLKPGSCIHALGVVERVSLHALEAEVLISEAEAVVAREEELAERRAALKSEFAIWAKAAGDVGVGAQWLKFDGTAKTALAEKGSRADVIIAEQPTDADPFSRVLFRAALFGTDRPVLMVPATGMVAPLGRKVAIAWREEKQTARVVIPALRYLGAAEIHILMGVRDPTVSPSLPMMFREHGVAARLHPLPIKPGPFGQRLLAKVHELGADLLVMGAYVHTPLRNLVLGGVTNFMLDNADIPVLMRH